MHRIVVGVDGSRASRRALAWAIAQARRDAAKVEVVHVWTVPDMGPDPLSHALADPAELERQARNELRLVTDGVDDAGLAVPIEPSLVRGDPVSTLVEAANGADLLVVGARGLGAGGDAALGSVCHGVIRVARCPVVVVPPDDTLATP
jgi:nucleotide-binding universal stress UspA family protein